MKKIIIDICHLPHVNFFKNCANMLSSMGHTVHIACLNRGRLPSVVEKEFPNFHILTVGRHRGTKFSIIFEANILRVFALMWLMLRNKYDLGLSVGSFTLGSVMKLSNKPNIQFDDDPERKKGAFLERATATKLFFPPIVEPAGNVSTYNALKEWSYLSPRYFKPNKNELARYGLSPKKYIFVREVSTGTLNYMHQEEDSILSVAERFPHNYAVVLSIENKKKIKQYPKKWLILEEPLEDIHSLLYYSAVVISSGDSMAREGAILGVPSIYCGIREMKANKILMDKGLFFKTSPLELPTVIEKITARENRLEDQEIYRQKLLSEWDDITEFVIKEVEKY